MSKAQLSDQGFADLRSGDFIKAYSVFDQLLSAEPLDPIALYGIALFWMINEHPDYHKADIFFKKSLSVDSSNVRIHINYGHLLISMNRIIEAKAVFVAALVFEEEQGELFHFMVYCDYKIEDFSQTGNYIDFGLLFCLQSNDNPELYEVCYTHLGKLFEAKLCGELKASLTDSTRNFALDYGNILIYLKQWDKMEEYFREMVEKNPNQLLPYEYLILSLEKNSRDDEAKVFCLKGLEIDPQSIYILQELSRIYLYEEDYLLGEKYLSIALLIQPENYDFWSDWIFAMVKLGRESEIITNYSSRPQDYHTSYVLGKMYFDLDNDELAWRNLSRAFELKLNDFYSAILLGRICESKGDVSRMMYYYEICVHANPSVKRIPHLLGGIFLDTGAFDKAMFYYSLAIQSKPHHMDAFNNLAAIFQSKGMFLEAASVFQEMITIFPEKDKWYCGLGTVYRDMMKEEMAEITFMKAIQFNPNSDMAYSFLGDLYQMKDLFKAEQYILKALSINPESIEGKLGLASVALLRNNEPRAYELSMELKSLDNYNTRLFDTLCQISPEINSSRDADFYRHNWLSASNIHPRLIARSIDFGLVMGAPMFLKRIIAEIEIEQLPFVAPKAVEIHQAKRKVLPFLQVITGWGGDNVRTPASLIAEAIININLGDPVVAFQLMHYKLTNESFKNSALGIYYYVLANKKIGESLIRELVELELDIHRLILNGNDQDIYYAALFYEQVDYLDRAINLLVQLKERYRQAGYKLAAIYKDILDVDSDTLSRFTQMDRSQVAIEFSTLNADILMMEKVRPFYMFGMSPVTVSVEATQFLADIQPVLHFIEVQDYIAQILPLPIQFELPFYDLIEVSGYNKGKPNYSLAGKLSTSWKKLVLTVLTDEDLKLKVESIKVYGQKAEHELGKLIKDGTTAEFYEKTEKVTTPRDFEFKLYMATICELYHTSHFTFEQAIDMVNYNCYCLNQIPDMKNNEVTNFFVDTIIELLIDSASVPYIFWLQKLNHLNKILKDRHKVKNSPIMDYVEYKAHMVTFQESN